MKPLKNTKVVKKGDINEYIKSLKASKQMGHQVQFHTVLPRKPADWSSPEKPWPAAVQRAMATAGIRDLYRHQSRAIDWIRAGHHVVIATPTASGKTLVYNLPFLE